MKAKLHKLPIRRDIEALRAIAVLAVVFYHAGVGVFQGGYVGVDIFFVISGFLITRILLNDASSINGISYKSFYIKRARRILPALFFTILLATIGAILIFPSNLLSLYGASLASSVLSISNIFFYTQSGYFDSSSNLKPLLHTWSLGVEEQFYLLWPIFIGLLLSKKISRYFLTPAIVILIGVLSLIAAQYVIYLDPAASFFLMPFRVFEFCLGAIVCWIKPVRMNNRYSTFIYIVSILLLAYAIFFFTENTAFPGINALVPSIGAALFIYANYQGFIEYLYKYFGLLYLGRLSYSIYLVHWPVVVFWAYFFDIDRVAVMDSASILLISLIFAQISFYAVESPLRAIQLKNSRFIFGAITISIIFIILGLSQSINNNGWPWRPWRAPESIDSKTLEMEKELRFLTRQKICSKKSWEKCDSIIPGKTNVLIIGDSHAVDALNALETQFPDFNYALSTLGGCPPYRNISEIAPSGLPDLEKCKTLNQHRHNISYLKEFDLIVINNFMGWYTPGHLISYLEFLHQSGINKVIVLDNYISLKKDLPGLINLYGHNEIEIRKWISEDYVVDPSLESRINELNYFYINKRTIFCNRGECPLLDRQGYLFTYDSNHLSYEFSKIMLTHYREKILSYMSVR